MYRKNMNAARRTALVMGLIMFAHVQAFDILQPLPKAPPIPDDNPMTEAKVELGRQLYFDPRLSVNGKLNCNACHNVMAAGDDGHALPVGATGKQHHRHAPTLWNAAFQTVLYWDGRSRSLEDQVRSHLLDPAVMAMPAEAVVVRRLAEIPGYRSEFAAVFGGDDAVTYDNVARAIAAYERTLLTPNSSFDRYIQGDKQAISGEAVRGMQLFNDTGCLSCHFGVNFAGPAPGPAIHMGEGFYELFPNTVGSPYDRRYGLMKDMGRYTVTRDPGHKRMWRVAPLRNIAVTAPYFHNGSVADLDEAIRVMARTQLKVTLPEQDVSAIRAFLESLTGEFPEQKLPRLPLEIGHKTAMGAGR